MENNNLYTQLLQPADLDSKGSVCGSADLSLVDMISMLKVIEK